MIRKTLLKLGQLTLLFAYSCGMQGQNFEEVVNNLIDGSVPLIQPDSLNQLLKKDNNVVVLDAREKEEYDVSHLKDAIWVGYKDFKIEDLSIKEEQELIVYCSIGYRSEKIGEKLQDAGYKNVNNLFGGIFGWNNSGYLIYDNSKSQTDKIHAYSKSWGKWVTKGEKVYE